LVNIDESTQLEISFQATTIACGDGSAPFELLLEVRDAVLLERWTVRADFQHTADR